MKTLKLSLLALFAMSFSISTTAKSETIVIKSSMVCDMCQDAIRDGLAYVKGIRRVTTDLDNNEITVKYNPKRISAEDIKQEITKIGYAADDMEADEAAYAALPECCKGSCPSNAQQDEKKACHGEGGEKACCSGEKAAACEGEGSESGCQHGEGTEGGCQHNGEGK